MTATPAVVAQRMADLLQCFPSAAIGGVQWCTLVRKYEEKHGTALNIETLGYDTALAAATALLWDNLRIVDKSDIDNPVVAVEDAVALTPSPSGLASWPSLYKSLCDITCNQGEVESTPAASHHIMLLSKVKPLLQRHWHSNFDELGLAYFTEDGSTVKLKKMKHLLQALLRWKARYVEWRGSLLASGRAAKVGCANELDEALCMELSLVPSTTRNDLVLCCVCPKLQCVPLVAADAVVMDDGSRHTEREVEVSALRINIPGRQKWADISDEEDLSSTRLSSSRESSEGVSPSSTVEADRLQEELVFLRSENAKLRCENQALGQQAILSNPFLQPDQSMGQVPDMFEEFDLDDPSEPPPPAPKYRYLPHSPACSTTASLGFGSGYCSGSQTPSFSDSSSLAHSGLASPMRGHAEQMCKGVPMPLMPMWFQIIPTGVVQEARAVFGGTSVPSWFANQQ